MSASAIAAPGEVTPSARPDARSNRLRRQIGLGPLGRLCFAVILGWACNQSIGLLFVSMRPTTVQNVVDLEQTINTVINPYNTVVCFSITDPSISDPSKDPRPVCKPFRSGERGLRFAILKAAPADAPKAGLGCPSTSEELVTTYHLECGEFFSYDRLLTGRLWAPIWTPAIEDSDHSFLRKLERTTYYSSGELKLCAGTRRPLSPDQCAKSADIEVAFSRLGLDEFVESWVRFGAMLCGIVQLLTWILFWLIVLDARRTSRVNLGPQTSLFRTVEQDGIIKLEQLEQEDFDEPYKLYRAHNARSIGDQLWVAYIPFDVAGNNNIGPTIPKAVPDPKAVDSERERLRSLAEDAISSLERMSENLLKLSFAGTIIGIGESLFEARNLDTADAIEKILIKSRMFAGIGTAFGNTLVGIGLSMVALFYVEKILSRWFRVIETNTNLIKDFAALKRPLKIHPVPPPPTPDDSSERIEVQRSMMENFGRTVLVLFILGVAVAHQSTLANLMSQAWASIARMLSASAR